jgi:hypothetical protein
MRDMRVLVFPCCNEPGLEVIDALRLHPRVEVWGASSIPPEFDPAVPVLEGRHATLPSLGTDGFREALRRFANEHAIEFVFPTVDAVVAVLSTWSEAFEVIAPDPELAQLVLSKAEVYAAVEDVVPVPRPFDPDRDPLPAFAKPEVGSGSRGATRLDTLEDVERAERSGLLVQEYLPGAEYTVDCVGDAEGQLVAASVRRRETIAGGIARASTCIAHAAIESYVRAIAARLPLAGPWFAQFREDCDGRPRLLEVNARIGGSSGVSRLAGINTPLIALLAFSGVPVVGPRRMQDVTIVRRLDRRGTVDDFDWVVWDLDDTLVHAGERVDPELAGWLYRFEQTGKRQALVSRNPDPAAVLTRTQLPDFFEEVISTEDKVSVVRGLMQRHEIEPERLVLINDSGAEKLVFERAIPGCRTIAPDAIGVLRG